MMPDGMTLAEWKIRIRMLEMTELTSIRLELANKCNGLITGNYLKWLFTTGEYALYNRM